MCLLMRRTGIAYYGKKVSKSAANGGQQYAYYRCILFTTFGVRAYLIAIPPGRLLARPVERSSTFHRARRARVCTRAPRSGRARGAREPARVDAAEVGCPCPVNLYSCRAPEVSRKMLTIFLDNR
jgi:hypothetical protein